MTRNNVIILADRRPRRPEPAGNPLAIVAWAFLAAATVTMIAAFALWVAR